MRKDYKDFLIPAFFIAIIILGLYGFAVLRGEWSTLFMAFFFILGICYYFDKYMGGSYALYSFIILISIFIFTLLYVNTARNNSTEKITIQGEVSKVYNNYKYVHFELKGYPDITFKSYDPHIRGSFKEYVADKYYEKIPVNIGKKARIVVFKSHLEWYKRPLVKFWKNLRFPLEVEIESFETKE